MRNLEISVILCTHNPREGYLRRVLEALRTQSLPTSQWELILIDNASEKPLAGRIDLSWHPQGEVLLEEKLGKMNAWTKGMKLARGKLLVFVDDDTVLDPDFLEQALLVGDKWPFVGAWSGSLRPEFETTPPGWCLDQSWRLTIATVKKDVWSNLPELHLTMPCGSGLCVRKNVVEYYLEWCCTHPLSTALDRKGNLDLITGYGDTNLAFCALDLGLGTGLSTRLNLTHLIPTSRLTLNYFLRHAEGDAASLMMFRAIRGLPIKEPIFSMRATIKTFIYRLVSGKPKELFMIEAAHRRGLKRGWKMVCEYRNKAKTP